MDRFIAHIKNNTKRFDNILKSNMDRFIVHCVIISTLRQDDFKIQYG